MWTHRAIWCIGSPWLLVDGLPGPLSSSPSLGPPASPLLLALLVAEAEARTGTRLAAKRDMDSRRWSIGMSPW